MKLADFNVPVAAALASHPHHVQAVQWLRDNRFATCPITEIGMMRVLMQMGADARDACAHLENVKRQADFIPCDVSGLEIAGNFTHHRQTTDAYLVALATKHKGKLHTFDEGIKGSELIK